MKKITFAILISILSLTVNAQTDIKIKVKNIKDTIAILGYHFGNKQYVTDTFKVKNGFCHIENEKNYPLGMYFILFPQNENRFFDFIMDNDQNFSITTDTAELYLKNIKIKSSLSNTELQKLNKKLNPVNKEFARISKLLKNDTLKQKIKDSLLLEVKHLEDKKNKIILQEYEKAKSPVFKDMLGVLCEIEVPEIKIPDTVQNKDSLRQIKEYYYYKNHYWDYVNFDDSAIVRTPFFQPKFERYISKVISQNPDTVLAEGIKLIEKSKSNLSLYSYLINYMLVYNEKSKRMGMDKVFVEIAKQYYQTGKATWADSAYKAKVIDKMKRTEYNLIGNKAVNLELISDKGEKVSLYDLDNDFVIIVFWSPTCGHCKKEIPQLYNIYSKLLEKGVDVEVLAVLENQDTVKWHKFIADKQINNWINAYDKDWKSYFHFYYDVYYTPTSYLLDKNKKIIAKRLSPKQLENYILYLNEKKNGD